MKEVHKSPMLDLVGWYSLSPISGPQPHHAAIQTKLSELYSESTIFLGFHNATVLDGSVGGKLPLTVYEVNVEPPEPNASEDVEMSDGQPAMKVTFKELPYSVETGEAEMISIDFVAKGGGNAAAVPTAAKKPKGKKKAEALQKAESLDDQDILSREDDELVASLTAKANAVRMLRSRIDLITAYLEKLPPSYRSPGTVEASAEQGEDHTPVDHSILRSIQALLNRLPLLIPSDNAAFNQELLAEENDVHLVALLSSLTESIKEAREAGQKFAVVEAGRKMEKNSSTKHDLWGIPTERSHDLGLTGAGDLIT